MIVRRAFLKGALQGSIVLLGAACGTNPSQPAATTAPAPQATSAPAAKPTTAAAAAPTAAPTAAAKPAAAATPAAAAPAAIGGAEVSLLQWNHFIPTADPF